VLNKFHYNTKTRPKKGTYSDTLSETLTIPTIQSKANDSVKVKEKEDSSPPPITINKINYNSGPIREAA